MKLGDNEQSEDCRPVDELRPQVKHGVKGDDEEHENDAGPPPDEHAGANDLQHRVAISRGNNNGD